MPKTQTKTLDLTKQEALNLIYTISRALVEFPDELGLIKRNLREIRIRIRQQFGWEQEEIANEKTTGGS